MFFHESLELLLHLRHPCLLLLSLGALQGRTLFGLGDRLFQGRHLGRGSCNINVGPVIIMQPSISIYIYRKVLCTLFILELLLGTAELALGPLEAFLQGIDLRSQCGRGQQRSLHSHIDIFLLDSCIYLFRSSARLFFLNTELSIRGYCLCGNNFYICF